MAKTLIEIRAETSQYQQAMRQAAAEMKNLTAQHSLAAAQAKLSGSAQDAPACKSDRTDIEDRCSKGDRAAEWTAV